MPLLFSQVFLTNNLGIHRDREICASITRWMDLWERGLHTVLVGDAEAEGAAKEGRASRGVEEEDVALARNYHDTVLSGKLSQAVHWATVREGGGCLLPDEQCTKTGRPVTEVL